MSNQDPADRLIVATAREMELTLLHTDKRVRATTGLKQRYFQSVALRKQGVNQASKDSIFSRAPDRVIDKMNRICFVPFIE